MFDDTVTNNILEALRASGDGPPPAAPLPPGTLGTEEDVRQLATRETRRILEVLTRRDPNREQDLDPPTNLAAATLAATTLAAAADTGLSARVVPASRVPASLPAVAPDPAPQFKFGAFQVLAASLVLFLFGAGAGSLPLVIQFSRMVEKLELDQAVRPGHFTFLENGKIRFVGAEVDVRYIGHAEVVVRSTQTEKVVFRQQLQPANPTDDKQRVPLNWESPQPLPVGDEPLKASVVYAVRPDLPEAARRYLENSIEPLELEFSATPGGVLLSRAYFLLDLPESLGPGTPSGIRRPVTIHSSRSGWVLVFVRAEGANRWSKMPAQRVPQNHQMQIDCHFVPGPNPDVSTTFHVTAALFADEEEPFAEQTDFASPPTGIMQTSRQTILAGLPYLAFHWTDEASKRGEVEWALRPDNSSELFLWYVDDNWAYRREPLSGSTGKVSVQIAEGIKELFLAPGSGEEVQVPRSQLAKVVAVQIAEKQP